MKWLLSKLFASNRRGSNSEIASLTRLFEDESFQNSCIPGPKERVIGGASVDEIPGSFGEFGLTLTNPVPVNGAIGELVYLSSLRHFGKTPILFHRLGSLDEIDIYETVTVDGSEWNIVYFDLYHPRKSTKALKGYSIVAGDRSGYGLRGVNYLVPNFPHGLSKEVGNLARRMLGSSIVPPEVQLAEQTVRFVRPKDHLRARDELEVHWVRRSGTYAEVARAILDLVFRESDELFPAYKEKVGQFWTDRNMLSGKRLAIYEHPGFKIALTACIAATWYCSVLALFAPRDAEMLANAFVESVNGAVDESSREIFNETFKSAVRAGANCVESTKNTKAGPSPAFGIADALLAVLLLRKDVSEPVDAKLQEEFILQFHHPFHYRSDEIMGLRMKYALIET
jgi:hypothetical protein